MRSPLFATSLLALAACAEGMDAENVAVEDDAAERIGEYERAVDGSTPDGRELEVIGEGPDYTREAAGDGAVGRYEPPTNTPPNEQAKYAQVGALTCPESQWLDLDDYAESQTDITTEFEAWLLEEDVPDGVVRTDSGLKYEVIQPGIERGYQPRKFDNVTVKYHGTLADGTVFDSSYERSETIEFKPGQVIAGWTEALMDMTPCEARTLYIPSELAYGKRGSGSGSIGPDTSLIFNVQILEVEG